jgi:hypothetical protein
MDLNGNNKQNKNYYEILQIKTINSEKYTPVGGY